MSAGIDIAGLALGILPIFVYAAGHYREGLDPLVTALHPGTRNRKLEDFYRDLHFEATLLHELLNRLFDELHGRSRRRSDSVLEKPELDIKPMESALQEKLGDAYQSFLEILQNSLRYFNHFVIDKGLNSVETRLVSFSDPAHRRNPGSLNQGPTHRHLRQTNTSSARCGKRQEQRGGYNNSKRPYKI